MFDPTKNFQQAMRNAFRPQLFPWDEYFSQMAEADFLSGGADVIAAKSFFIRKAPFGGSYALLGGITAALNDIASLNFKDPFFSKGMWAQKSSLQFVDYLEREGRLRLKVYAPGEGSLMFPNEPIMTVVCPLPHVRFVEGIITEACNFASLSLTKWYRLVRTVRPGRVLDFSRRRAQNAPKSTVYAMLAGCFGTSNSEMGRYFSLNISGTMGHEWIQRYGDVKRAFDYWLSLKPNRPIGLVDTMNCLKHDFPIWLDAVFAARERIMAADAPVWGWRNDSGDLAYLTIEQYRMFMKHELAKIPWFVERMRVTLTNDLDEHSAKSIIEQIQTQAGAAGLDPHDILRRIVWAAGTKPGTCNDQPSLGGVMKLAAVEDDPCIKLAFDSDGLPGEKTSIPGFNRSAIIRDGSGEVAGVLIYPAKRYDIVDGKFYTSEAGSELRTKKIEKLLMCHPDNPGSKFEVSDYMAVAQQKLVWDSLDQRGYTPDWNSNLTIEDISRRIVQQVDGLHWSMTRLEKPHKVKVSLTPDLFDLRQRMIKEGALRGKFLK